jgi:hypothetical protein
MDKSIYGESINVIYSKILLNDYLPNVNYLRHYNLAI